MTFLVFSCHSFPKLQKNYCHGFCPTSHQAHCLLAQTFCLKIEKIDKPSVKELALRTKQKHVRFATHASNFFSKA